MQVSEVLAVLKRSVAIRAYTYTRRAVLDWDDYGRARRYQMYA